MAIIQVLLVVFALNLDQIQSTYTEVIQTRSGKVRGQVQDSSIPGIKVQKFLNIPYAEAPTGELRFEKPQPKKPWNGTLNSTETRIACFQIYHSAGLNLTEDCLVLNVWAPYPTPTNATVMVYIHGGSFTSGGAQDEKPGNVVAVGEVIVVTMNYRLSFLGFLNTGNERIKGNFGLFDQRLAMKWVKENIAAFGGDPKTITLFGLSAGSASVSAHTLSEGSWPYFDRAILQSGNMLNSWAVLSEAAVKKATDAVLKAVNCKNDENVLACLKTNVTEEELQKIYTTQPFPLQSLEFSPSVDQDFLADHPVKLFRSGRVKNSSIILGVTKDEMYYFNRHILWQTRDITNITRIYEGMVRTHFKDKPARVSEYAIQLYSPECTPSFIEAFRPLVDIGSDLIFTCGIRQEAIIRSTLMHKVYLYRYSYATPVPYSVFPQGQLGFAAHGADILSSFGFTINNPRYPAEDQILSVRMVLYWTNFAKTGNPNSGTTKLPLALDTVNVDTLPKWPPHSSNEQEYLDMRSLSQMVVGTKLREKYCEFLLNPEDVSAEANTNTGATSSHTEHLLFLGVALLYYNF